MFFSEGFSLAIAFFGDWILIAYPPLAKIELGKRRHLYDFDLARGYYTVRAAMALVEGVGWALNEEQM